MKRIFILGLITTLAAISFSCSKDETDPDQTNQPINEAQLQGKWEVVADLRTDYDKDGKVKDSGGTRKGDSNWRDEYVTYMTFNADKTYNHSSASGLAQGIILQDTFPQKGKWALKDENKILQISTFADPNNIFSDWRVLEFSANKMRISYTEQDASGEKHEHTLELVK